MWKRLWVACNINVILLPVMLLENCHHASIAKKQKVGHWLWLLSTRRSNQTHTGTLYDYMAQSTRRRAGAGRWTCRPPALAGGQPRRNSLALPVTASKAPNEKCKSSKQVEKDGEMGNWNWNGEIAMQTVSQMLLIFVQRLSEILHRRRYLLTLDSVT